MDVVKSNPSPRKRFFRRGIIILAILALAPLLQLSASVLVAPTAVFLSDADRTGRMTIQNPTDKPKEVSIFFSFGLPESDSLGNVQVRLQDSGITDTRSAVDWLKAFPRKMVLAPGATQVVRFVARPPKDLPDGEYWARIVVRSQESQTSLPSQAGDDKITTKLNMIIQTAIILKYRTGNLVAKLDVVDTQVVSLDSAVNIFVNMENRGNVSYVGILQGRLLDAKNREISTERINLAVYHSLIRRLHLPFAEGNFQKPYHVEIFITNEGRKDLDPQNMIVGNKILLTMAAD